MSTEEAIDLMADAGFDAIDFSFHLRSEYYNADTDGELGRIRFTEWRKRAEALGLVFNQAHAPEGSSFTDMDRTVQRFHEIRRAIRNASYLGVPIIVVHPVQHLPYCEAGVPEQLFEMNMKFYSALKPYCEEYNIKIALENMWQHRGRKIVHSTCSRPEEFNRYLDALDKDPGIMDKIGAEGQCYRPEIVFYAQYSADAEGNAYTMQYNENGPSTFVIHRPEELPFGIRWISRTEDEDTLGMVLPATSEHLGKLYCQRNGQSKFLAKGETVTYHMQTGLLNRDEADALRAKIKSMGF